MDEGPRPVHAHGAVALSATDSSYAATSTLIVRGFASSRYGSFTVSTPLRYSAATFEASTVVGKVNDRMNAP